MAIKNLTVSDEEFKTAFLSGKFVIDCVEIKLTQNDTEISSLERLLRPK